MLANPGNPGASSAPYEERRGAGRETEFDPNDEGNYL
jgi:hypothetical protein